MRWRWVATALLIALAGLGAAAGAAAISERDLAGAAAPGVGAVRPAPAEDSRPDGWTLTPRGGAGHRLGARGGA